MKYELVLTDKMKEDRMICGKDANVCEECSCRMGNGECIFNHLYVTAELPEEQLLEKTEAIKIIKSLMSACQSDSKYYKVGKMAIKAIEQIRSMNEEAQSIL